MEWEEWETQIIKNMKGNFWKKIGVTKCFKCEKYFHKYKRIKFRAKNKKHLDKIELSESNI